MNKIITIKEFKQNIAELCEEVGFGVALNSVHHPENDGVVPESLNADSLETIEIEIPMNKRLKELAEQAGLEEHPVHGDWTSLNWPDVRGADLERFAELVRHDERQGCAEDYLKIMRDAVKAARLDEREACAKLCEEQDEYGCGQYAKAIRARGEK